MQTYTSECRFIKDGTSQQTQLNTKYQRAYFLSLYSKHIPTHALTNIIYGKKTSYLSPYHQLYYHPETFSEVRRSIKSGFSEHISKIVICFLQLEVSLAALMCSVQTVECFEKGGEKKVSCEIGQQTKSSGVES